MRRKMKKQDLKRIITMTVASIVIFTITQVNTLASWEENNIGWRYKEDQEYAKNWRNIDGKWYYFDNSGYMKNGWVYDSSKWYYLCSDGSMKSGWIYDNGNWFFADYNGEMQTGLIEVEDKVYYLSSSGAMKTGDVIIGDKIYSFTRSGEAKGDNIQKVTKAFTIDGLEVKPTEINSTNEIGKKIVEIDLESNPTTGYEWKYDIDNEGIIKQVSKVYKQDEAEKGILGSGGKDIWTFEGIKEGSTQVTFKYLRSWEGEVVKTKTFIFTVDKELGITVKGL
jgi:predicted secreted protein